MNGVFTNQFLADDMSAESGCRDLVNIDSFRLEASAAQGKLNDCGRIVRNRLPGQQRTSTSTESPTALSKLSDFVHDAGQTLPGAGHTQSSAQSHQYPACLVISPDALRTKMFSLAVARTGWTPLTSTDWLGTQRQLASGVVYLAIVDIASKTKCLPDDRRCIVEWLTTQYGVLTVVCGRSGQPAEEIWAREQGVWAYLPGVAPEADLNHLLLGAKQLLAKQLKNLFEFADQDSLPGSPVP
jgi:hypothetical protein